MNKKEKKYIKMYFGSTGNRTQVKELRLIILPIKLYTLINIY